MKHSRYLLTMLLIAFLCACTSEGEQEAAKPEPQLPDLVMQIQKQSRLYSTECHVHKIISHNDSQQLLGSILGQQFSIDLPLGKRSVAIPIDATVKAYIDFGEFTDNNVRRRGDQIEIILPDPKLEITSTRINHDEVKQYVPLLRKNFTDEELTKLEHADCEGPAAPQPHRDGPSKRRPRPHSHDCSDGIPYRQRHHYLPQTVHAHRPTGAITAYG